MSQRTKVAKAVQKLADQIWESLAAYAATLVYVPYRKDEEDDE